MGLYTPEEAARFTKLRQDTFNRWFYGNQRGEAVVRPQLEPRDEVRVVTFWDLIQAVGIRRLRTATEKRLRPSLSHIRQVVDECQERGITHPLARKHTLYWYANRLILQTEEGDLIGTVPGLDKNQLYQGKIIEPYLKEIVYDENLMARIWTPLESRDCRVNLNADRRFGLPIIEPYGVLTNALTDAVSSEGSIEAAADAFEVPEDAVMLAIKFDDYLSSAA